MTDFVKRKSSDPDQVDFLMELYREGWKLEDLKKISECEQIEEMKQVKENIERARSYQKNIEFFLNPWYFINVTANETPIMSKGV